jgi:hypothetical protein
MFKSVKPDFAAPNFTSTLKNPNEKATNANSKALTPFEENPRFVI